MASMHDAVRVRRATPDDAEAIAAIHTRAWHVAYRHVFPPERLETFASDASGWRETLRPPQERAAVLVAERGGAVAGFASVGASRDDDAREASGELYAIYVDPDAWGGGAGRELLRAAEEALRAAGFDEATLWVLEQNPRARRFYEAGGWRLDEARKDDRFFGVDVTEVRYRKRLVPEVLFVCVHNAGRSQMAAALLDHHARGRVRVRSAGSEPAERVNPAAVEAMAELGLDLSNEFPKPLEDGAVRTADVVITMGCGDVCPVYPGKRYEDWELDDPAGKPVAEVRRIRDEIDRRVRALLDELEP